MHPNLLSDNYCVFVAMCVLCVCVCVLHVSVSVSVFGRKDNIKVTLLESNRYTTFVRFQSFGTLQVASYFYSFRRMTGHEPKA